MHSKSPQRSHGVENASVLDGRVHVVVKGPSAPLVCPCQAPEEHTTPSTGTTGQSCRCRTIRPRFDCSSNLDLGARGIHPLGLWYLFPRQSSGRADQTIAKEDGQRHTPAPREKSLAHIQIQSPEQTHEQQRRTNPSHKIQL